jgi:hypothetical protein
VRRAQIRWEKTRLEEGKTISPQAWEEATPPFDNKYVPPMVRGSLQREIQNLSDDGLSVFYGKAANRLVVPEKVKSDLTIACRLISARDYPHVWISVVGGTTYTVTHQYKVGVWGPLIKRLRRAVNRAGPDENIRLRISTRYLDGGSLPPEAFGIQMHESDHGHFETAVFDDSPVGKVYPKPSDA